MVDAGLADSKTPPRPPDLTELVARHGNGGLSAIPADAWVEWDRLNEEYKWLRHDYYRGMAAQNRRRWRQQQP